MELQQLKYFLAVAQNEQINKTAQELMITPSAISVSITKLESELGVKLFEKVGRNIVITEQGKLYAKQIKEVLLALERANESIQQIDNSNETLEICAVNPFLWHKPVQAFQSLHPEISTVFKAIDTGSKNETPQDEVSQSKADFYIASKEYFTDCNLKKQLLINAPLIVAVSKKHRIAKMPSVDLANLKDEWFINSPHNTSFREFCDDLCLLAGFEPKSHIECDYIVRPNILKNDLATVCICTALSIDSRLYDGCALIPLKSPNCYRTFYICWKPQKKLSKPALLFKDFMINYYKNLNK